MDTASDRNATMRPASTKTGTQPPVAGGGLAVEVACVVCGGLERRVLLYSEGVAAQMRYLERFHGRRLRQSAGVSRGSAHPATDTPRPGEPTSGPAAPRESEAGGTEDATLADRAKFTQSSATDIVECVNCGLVYRNPRPPADEISHAYLADHYGPRRLADLFDSQLALWSPKARRLAEWLPARPGVVEVGSFVGGFLAAGQRLGWEVLGVDPGEEVDSFCHARGLPVLRSTLPQADLPGGSADCVAIWNTLDQLPDPRPTLLASIRLLKRGGLLALRVPNGRCFARLAPLASALPRPLSGWLRAAMAWSNLLGFPYLHGYSVSCLDRLLTPMALQRASVEADLLPRLSGRDTAPWARSEEAVLKLMWRAALLQYRISAPRPAAHPRPGEAAAVPSIDEDMPLAPWLDLLYRYAPGGAGP